MSVSQIKRWNNLSSNNIRVGQRLVIYRGGKGPSTSSSNKSNAKAQQSGTAQKQPSQAQPAKGSTSQGSQQQPASGSYTVYTVKSGDSLYTIAKNYPGVSAQDIMNFNGIGSSIKPGMKIKIPKN